MLNQNIIQSILGRAFVLLILTNSCLRAPNSRPELRADTKVYERPIITVRDNQLVKGPLEPRSAIAEGYAHFLLIDPGQNLMVRMTSAPEEGTDNYGTVLNADIVSGPIPNSIEIVYRPLCDPIILMRHSDLPKARHILRILDINHNTKLKFPFEFSWLTAGVTNTRIEDGKTVYYVKHLTVKDDGIAALESDSDRPQTWEVLFDLELRAQEQTLSVPYISTDLIKQMQDLVKIPDTPTALLLILSTFDAYRFKQLRTGQVLILAQAAESGGSARVLFHLDTDEPIRLHWDEEIYDFFASDSEAKRYSADHLRDIMTYIFKMTLKSELTTEVLAEFSERFVNMHPRYSPQTIEPEIEPGNPEETAASSSDQVLEPSNPGPSAEAPKAKAKSKKRR